MATAKDKDDDAPAKPAAKGKTNKVKLIRHCFLTEGVKTPAGTVIDVPVDQAKDLVAKKIAELQFDD